MKVLCLSNRFYYRELDDEVKEVIKHDLNVYNFILHKAYKLLYDKAYKELQLKDSLQKMMKSEYGTSDYIPLSAINEAKALLKANTASNQRLIKQSLKRINRIKYKIREKENEINKYHAIKNNLIQKCRVLDYTEIDYLYEVSIDKKLKETKNQLKQIVFRLNRETQRKEKLERVPREYKINLNQQDTRKEQWKKVVKRLGKATLQECQITPVLCLFR